MNHKYSSNADGFFTFENIRVEMMTTGPSYMDNYYFKPWTRATPYLIGIWVGWLLNRVNKSKFQLPSVIFKISELTS